MSRRLYFFAATILLILVAFAGCRAIKSPITLPETSNQTVIFTPLPENPTATKPETKTEITPQPAPTKPPVVETKNGYRIVKDIVYGMGGSIPQKLDIYIPDKKIASPTPAVVFIHGGGWSQGDKYPSQISLLAQNGFFCVSINYRLSGVAPFPAAVEDCKCSIRWLRAHAAEYGVDPEHIGVWGGSAGGHLSLMVGLVDKSAGLEGNGGWADYSSRVQAVCSYYGPTDMMRLFNTGDKNAPSAFIGGKPSEKPDTFYQASPINYVSPDDPPVLMVHGDQDPVVPPEQSRLMFEAYQKAGLEAKLTIVQNAGHGFQSTNKQPISPDIKEINNQVLDFFMKHLVNKR